MGCRVRVLVSKWGGSWSECIRCVFLCACSPRSTARGVRVRASIALVSVGVVPPAPFA